MGPAEQGTCDPAVINGVGDLAIGSVTESSWGFNFVSADGHARYAESTKSETVGTVAPRAKGFAIVRHEFATDCDYSSLLETNAPPIEATLIDGPRASDVRKVIPNPLGGFVEARTGLTASLNIVLNRLELRWVDENLQARGDWHTAMTWPAFTENEWLVNVDQLGRAFLLSFNYPPTLGSLPAPTSWTFSARWMDIDGPIGDAFAPIAPNYIAPSGKVYFADWDVVRPLSEGGFAVFHWPNLGPGTLSNAGWYAYCPSGQRTSLAPPAWLSSYDGSVNLIANGRAYAALRRDPATCARTVSLISLSGTKCYEMSLPHSVGCDATDRIQADGTVLMQAGCPVRWWPQAVRLTQ